MAKAERGTCPACCRRSVERVGVSEIRQRPEYACQNGACGRYKRGYTMGNRGHAWDTQPAPSRDEVTP